MRVGNIISSISRAASKFGSKVATSFEGGVDAVSDFISTVADKLEGKEKDSFDRVFEAAAADAGKALGSIGERFHNVGDAIKDISIKDDDSFFSSLNHLGDKFFHNGPLHNLWEAAKDE